ncbi:hypothetical protein PO909_030881 [Leuciscus waleckii]
MFWLGATFHQHIDLPDTSNLNWMEAVIRCLESVEPRSSTQPDPEPGLPPWTVENSCVPPADGELPPVATRQPEPETKRTELTLAPEEELQQESDQGCEPTTSADEGTQSTDHEDWLKSSSEETPFPTLSHPSSTSSLSSDLSGDYIYPVIILSSPIIAPQGSASPPAPPLLDVRCPGETQVSSPSAVPGHEDLVAPPPALVLCTPSRPVDLPAPSWLLPPAPPPESLEPSASSGSLVLPAPPWSVVTLPPPRTYGPSAMLRPSTPSATAGSSFPLGVTSVLPHSDSASALGYSGSISSTRRCDVAWVSQSSDVVGVHRLSVCAYGSCLRVSVGHPPASVSLFATWSLPSLNSAVGCRYWAALGLRHQAISISAIRGSSSSLHHPVTPASLLHFLIASSTARTSSGPPSVISLQRGVMSPVGFFGLSVCFDFPRVFPCLSFLPPICNHGH